MKPALLEVMRMNRICRMVLATCFGSFILVIFYFQIMRRNPFGVDICCRKGSRSPLQELYNPIQRVLISKAAAFWMQHHSSLHIPCHFIILAIGLSHLRRMHRQHRHCRHRHHHHHNHRQQQQQQQI